MYAEERLKADIVKEALEKNSKAVFPPRDGKGCREGRKSQYPSGVQSF